METFQDVPAFWDFTTAAPFSDADFMSMLQKDFPAPDTTDPLAFQSSRFNESVDPQSITTFHLPSMTPPSEDSSPSPPNSSTQDNEEADGPAPKRKATDDNSEAGPNPKSQHTLSNDKKNAQASSSTSNASRRKSSGTFKDEGRLLKRKEQNRAAQRAFRERKEKHVKDLEDRVAALEAKNEEAAHENENLRDLLARLQSENVMLKQSQFTFSMPRDGPQQQSFSTDTGAFPPAIPSSSRSSFASPASSSKSPKMSNPLDWSSLTSFDPSRLTLLDETPQQTATEGAMQLDFGFGTGLASNAPYTSIASNPMFMSFASTFDSTPPSSSDSPNVTTSAQSPNPSFNFDLNSLTAWPTGTEGQGLDDLLSGYLGNTNNDVYSSFLTSPANISPVAHHITTAGIKDASSQSSPSTSSTDPIFTPNDSATPDSEHDHSECPRTRGELAKRIEGLGHSPFAPKPETTVRKSTDVVLGTMISCAGTSNLPKTPKSDQNVEVLSAWRSITSNPKFKDTDISELCSEFTNKARCDGTKVVLEPSGVHSILENLSKKQQF